MVNRQCEVEDRDRPKTDFPFSVRLGLGLTLDFPFLFFEKKTAEKEVYFSTLIVVIVSSLSSTFPVELYSCSVTTIFRRSSMFWKISMMMMPNYRCCMFDC